MPKLIGVKHDVEAKVQGRVQDGTVAPAEEGQADQDSFGVQVREAEADEPLTAADREDAPSLYEDLTFGVGEEAVVEDGSWLDGAADQLGGVGAVDSRTKRSRPAVGKPTPKPARAPKPLPLPIARTFAEHRQRWQNCQNCALGQQRSQVVLAAGKLPADVAFVAQAPGDSEDATGVPLYGPAGARLDFIEREAFSAFGHLTRCRFNLVACYPRNAKNAKARGDRADEEPEPVEIRACAERLREMASLARPKLVVFVGSLAKRWWPQLVPVHFWTQIGCEPPKVCHILHPAAILKMSDLLQGLKTQEVIIELETVLRKVFSPSPRSRLPPMV